jgi:hypothetical protein
MPKQRITNGSLMKESLDKLLKPGPTLTMPAAPPFPYKLIHAHTWSIPQTIDYLTEVIELPQYANHFLKASINGRAFISLSGKTLPEILQHTDHQLHLKKILSHAERLRDTVLDSVKNVKNDIADWSDLEVAVYLRENQCPNAVLAILKEKITGYDLTNTSIDDMVGLFSDVDEDEKALALELLMLKLPAYHDDNCSNRETNGLLDTATKDFESDYLMKMPIEMPIKPHSEAKTTKKKKQQTAMRKRREEEYDMRTRPYHPDNELAYEKEDFSMHDYPPRTPLGLRGKDVSVDDYDDVSREVYQEDDEEVDRAIITYDDEDELLVLPPDYDPTSKALSKSVTFSDEDLHRSSNQQQQKPKKSKNKSKTREMVPETSSPRFEAPAISALEKTIDKQAEAIRHLNQGIQDQNERYYESIRHGQAINRDVIEALVLDRNYMTNMLAEVMDKILLQNQQMAHEQVHRDSLLVNLLQDHQRPPQPIARPEDNQPITIASSSNSDGSRPTTANSAVAAVSSKGSTVSLAAVGIHLKQESEPEPEENQINQRLATATVTGKSVIVPSPADQPVSVSSSSNQKKSMTNKLFEEINIHRSIKEDSQRLIASYESLLSTYHIDEQSIISFHDTQFAVGLVARIWLRLGWKMLEDYRAQLISNPSKAEDEEEYSVASALRGVYKSVYPIIEKLSDTRGKINGSMLAAAMVYMLGFVRRLLSSYQTKQSNTSTAHLQVSLLVSDLISDI